MHINPSIGYVTQYQLDCELKNLKKVAEAIGFQYSNDDNGNVVYGIQILPVLNEICRRLDAIEYRENNRGSGMGPF